MGKMGGFTRTKRKKQLLMIWGVNGKAPCWWCLKIVEGEKASIEHLLPQSRGGSHHLDNLRIACLDCNSGHVNPLDESHKFAKEKYKALTSWDCLYYS
jgi:5-methylcytosine-specific restriction endonuclease McrA